MNGARPLAGIAIAQIGGEVATRYCARLFALLGADVWRAEDDGGVDALYGAWLDQAKQVVDSPEAVLAALDASDAPRKLVICGQTPARIAATEALVGGREIPMLAISWFDPRGPYADRNANDPIIQAMSGLAFSFGPVEGPPTLAQGCEMQVVGGITAFNAALAALISDVRPRRIETSIFEAALCFTEPGAVGSVAFGWEARRLGVNRYLADLSEQHLPDDRRPRRRHRPHLPAVDGADRPDRATGAGDASAVHHLAASPRDRRRHGRRSSPRRWRRGPPPTGSSRATSSASRSRRRRRRANCPTIRIGATAARSRR